MVASRRLGVSPVLAAEDEAGEEKEEVGGERRCSAKLPCSLRKRCRSRFLPCSGKALRFVAASDDEYLENQLETVCVANHFVMEQQTCEFAEAINNGDFPKFQTSSVMKWIRGVCLPFEARRKTPR